MVEKKGPDGLNYWESLFGTRNLYEVLGAPKDSSPQEIRKCYYKKALLLHPDRHNAENEDTKQEMTRKFQALGVAYEILFDEEKRKIYDETGEMVGFDDENSAQSFSSDMDWEKYFSKLYRKISPEDIEEFRKNYVGSELEEEDLKQLYVSHEGDMDLILECVMCCSDEDEPRFREILNRNIDSGAIPSFPKFRPRRQVQDKLRKRKAKDEAMMAEKLADQLGLKGSTKTSDMDELSALIQSRQKGRNDFMHQLEEKYSAKTKVGKKTS
eukprot:Sdes_comp21239_c0_seq1m19893